MISAYLPSASGLLGLAATLVVLAALVGVGKLVVPDEERPESFFAAGYGCVLIVVTLIGTATTLPLTCLFVGVIAAGGLGFFWFLRREAVGRAELGRAVLLALP